MIKAYPLEWPLNYPRTKYPLAARFRQSFAKARDGIINEIRRLRGTDIIISTNIHLKPDGFPYANFMKSPDCGVAVYFNWKKKQMVLACDKWNTVADNMTAIFKTIENIRGIERWGVSEFLERSFTGFEALPEASENWWKVLGCDESSEMDFVKNCYRDLVKQHHPDSKNGERKEFERIQKAWEQYQQTLIK